MSRTKDRAVQARRALLGALLGATTGPLASAMLWEAVARPLFRAPRLAEYSEDAFLTSALCGAILGAAALARFGGIDLPRWLKFVAMGVLAGTLALAVLSTAHCSMYESKAAAPIKRAWLYYGAVPFLIGGAIAGFGVFKVVVRRTPPAPK